MLNGRSVVMSTYLSIHNLWSILTLILDIGLIAIVIYYCLKVVKNNSRTIQIFKGILLVFIVNGLAQLLGLKTIEYFTTQFLNWGVLAIIIIFQPEIRSLLEKLGKTTVFTRLSTLSVNERERLVNELVKTCVSLSKMKTGALISIEQGQSLSDYIKTGTAMNSVVSSELLCSIFQYGTPLHDGAVIIQGDKIACASAYFPPTAKDFPSSYGARHRAAVGISEVSDCVTIVISEESGNISLAKEGSLIVVNEQELREFLMATICSHENEEEKEDNKEEDKKESKVEKTDNTANEQNSKLKIHFMSKNKKNKKFEKKKVENTSDKIEAQEIVIHTKKDSSSNSEGSDQ